MTLTGLELVRVLRAFARSRCDAAGLQGFDDWAEVLTARPADEEAFLASHAELGLRAGVESLCGAKEFAEAVLAGEPVFTRQGDEPSPV